MMKFEGEFTMNWQLNIIQETIEDRLRTWSPQKMEDLQMAEALIVTLDTDGDEWRLSL